MPLGDSASTGWQRALPAGEMVLVCPRHVCSTVHLFDEMALVSEDGSVELVPIEGRTRQVQAT